MDKKEKKLLKKMDKEKNKNEKKQQKVKKTPKEHMASFFHKIKEYCIKDTSRMILLMAILVAVYIVINLAVGQINLAQIDLTKEKRYTLTDRSKSIAKSIDKEMTFYVWGYSESDQLVDLLKQYNAQNDKIKYKLVSSDDVETINKFNFEEDDKELIGVASDDRTSYITASDLYTYDSNSQVIDLTEQKITNAINNLSQTEETKVYFVEGRTKYTTESGIYYLSQYLSEEYYDVGTINIVSDPIIPEDCNILAIMGLSSDFTEQEADSICKYIEKGGDIIITNDIDTSGTANFPNFQKILNEYDAKLPNKIVQENSEDNRISGYDNIVFQAEVASDNEITRKLYNSKAKAIVVGTGIIETDSTKLAEDNITATPIVMTSSKAITSDLTSKTTETNTGNQYTIGETFQKTVADGNESRAVIFATTSAFSDNSLDGQTPMFLYNNNIILNSFAFTSNRGEYYEMRKASSYVPYTATNKEDKIVRAIIAVIPVAIGAFGVCVWIYRRKLK